MKFDHPHLLKAHHYVTWGSAGVSVRLTRVRAEPPTKVNNHVSTAAACFSIGYHCSFCTLMFCMSLLACLCG